MPRQIAVRAGRVASSCQLAKPVPSQCLVAAFAFACARKKRIISRLASACRSDFLRRWRRSAPRIEPLPALGPASVAQILSRHLH
jgi:hypothetical protein